jgi:hypothetical protein
MPALAEPKHLSSNEVLDRVDVLHTTIRQAEVEVLILAVRFALVHGAIQTDTPSAKPLPGRAGLKQLGGTGTPMVAEFAPVLLGARLGLSAYAGASLVADALDLYYRLPLLWQRVQDLDVKASYAREVARRTRSLPRAHAVDVDAQVAEEADGRVSWSRFTDLIDAAIIATDPAEAARREARAAMRQCAHATRSSEYGMRGFFLHAPFPVIARLDATVAYLAQALLDFGDTATLDERRVKAVLILANPTQAVHLLRAYATWRAGQLDAQPPAHPDRDALNPGPVDAEPSTLPDPDLDAPQHMNPADATPGPINSPVVNDADLLPVIRLFVHLTQEAIENDCKTGVARIDGQPPISARWVKQHLGGCRLIVTPVLDLAHQIPADAWEIPVRHRHAVHLMTPADTFPFATNTTRSKQIDHTIPYDPTGPPGQSRIGNYGPMTVFHHRLKTHGGWQVAQPFPGVYLWRDPTGMFTYLVDHTGTRRLDRAA